MEILVCRSVQVFGFWGKKTETDLPRLVSRGKDLLPTTKVVGLASVRSNLVGFFMWGGSLEFGWVGQL